MRARPNCTSPARVQKAHQKGSAFFVEREAAAVPIREGLRSQFLAAMRSAVLFLALVGLALVHAAEVEEEDDVLVLTQENFDQVIDSTAYVLVEFCKLLSSLYHKICSSCCCAKFIIFFLSLSQMPRGADTAKPWLLHTLRLLAH